jgi:hypothetical protein
MKGRWINFAATAFALAFLQEAVDDRLVQIDKGQAVPFKPSCEVIQEPQLHSHS